jgi:hypothetical protein
MTSQIKTFNRTRIISDAIESSRFKTKKQRWMKPGSIHRCLSSYKVQSGFALELPRGS